MTDFGFQELEAQGAYLIESFCVGDNRGRFTKNFEKDIFKNAGIEFCLSESFVSLSMKNVIRGLHFQIQEPQAKLVSVVSGRIWDVIVDIRQGSQTYKKWIAHELSADNHLSFYIPRGFAHGFVSLEDNTVVLYQCDGRYDSKTDTGILYNDSSIEVKWPICEKDVICSKRDLELMSFDEFEKKDRDW